MHNDGLFSENYLNEQPAEYETEFVRHVKFDSPIIIKINGKKRMGVVLKP